SWHCSISDDGKGFELDKPLGSNRYGIKIMKDRAEAMGWKFMVERHNNKTIISIRKETTAGTSSLFAC
ncbi:hypothetical protein GNF85_23175, partial [Clostridium perfringens]